MVTADDRATLERIEGAVRALETQFYEIIDLLQKLTKKVDGLRG